MLKQQVIEIGKILESNEKLKSALQEKLRSISPVGPDGCQEVKEGICSIPIELKKRWTSLDDTDKSISIFIDGENYRIIYNNEKIIEHLICVLDKMDNSILNGIEVSKDVV